MDNGNGVPKLFAEDFMKTKVFKVPRTSRTLECIKLMSSKDVNSLVVLNDDDTYLGTVSIEDIKALGKPGKEIAELVTNDVITVSRKEGAQIAFDKLLSSKSNYVIVLNDNQTVAGLITRTSMAKALGEALWGEVL
jgi:osmoprotectant transport system ATP-binding protein